jgi:hypothetical protein
MKITWLKLLVMFLMSFLISSCSTLDLSTKGGLPSGEKIIEKNIKATGGRRAHESVRNNKIDVTVNIVPAGMVIKATSYKERPNKDHSTADLGAMGKRESGSDGKIAWEINPLSGARLLEGEQLALKLLENSFDGPDAWKKIYKSVTNEGVEDVGGKECYKVLFIPKEGSPRITYYDKETFLANKIAYEAYTDQGTSQAEIHFLDYEKMGKILTPQKIQVYLNGQLYEDVTIDNVETNIEMPEGTFDLPEEIKALLK